MKRKLKCPWKHELCEECRQGFVPVTNDRVNGRRLCTNCIPRELANIRFAYVEVV